jgi:hypothetical protein
MKAAQRVGIQGVGQRGLGGEVVVQAAVAHARSLAHLVHGRGGKALRQKRLGGGFKDCGLW